MIDITRIPSPFVPNPAEYIPKELRNRYGLGLKYPAECGNKEWAIANGQEAIRYSIWITLLTPVGTRYMRPDFGSMIPFLVYENINDSLFRDLKFYSKDALDKWEPRIVVTSCDIDSSGTDSNMIQLIVNYIIKGTNTITYFRVPITLDNSRLVFVNPAEFTISGRNIFG